MNDSIQRELAREIMLAIEQFKRSSNQYYISGQRVKPSEFILLRMLKGQNEKCPARMRVSEISNKLHITPSAVTHTINSLEKSGFIKRLADPSDRRIVLVSITDKGNTVCQHVYEKHIHFLEGLVDYLGEEDSKEFIRLLSAALDYFKVTGNNNNNRLQS